MRTVYTITEADYGLALEDIEVGKEYVLIERYHIFTGKSVYRLIPDNGEGISGNMDSDIKRYHGWRGTTNDISVYAHGLRRVERTDKIIEPGNWMTPRRMTVKLSADLVPDRP